MEVVRHPRPRNTTRSPISDIEDGGSAASTAGHCSVNPASEYVIDEDEEIGNANSGLGVSEAGRPRSTQEKIVNAETAAHTQKEHRRHPNKSPAGSVTGQDGYSTVAADRRSQPAGDGAGAAPAYRGAADAGADHIGSALVHCPRCGAWTEEGLDCREAASCDAEPDAALFEPYQPRHRPPYDLRNSFDRTHLYGEIFDEMRRANGYLETIRSLAKRGVMSSLMAQRQTEEVLQTLGRHRRAMCRLETINTQEEYRR